MQKKLQAQSPTHNESPGKPEFRLPKGYRLGWAETYDLDGKKVGWHVLRNSQGEKLGFFEFVPGETVEVVLKSHLEVKIVEDTRGETKAIIVLEDSYRKELGKWELDQYATNPIEVLVKYLANR